MDFAGARADGVALGVAGDWGMVDTGRDIGGYDKLLVEADDEAYALVPFVERAGVEIAAGYFCRCIYFKTSTERVGRRGIEGV